MVSKFARARSADQKDVRRRQLLEAAVRLFDAERWERITVAEVAKRAGLAKGTTYRYFETKEALFLEVLIGGLASWAEVVRRAGGPGGRRAVAWTLARSLIERPRLLRLLGLQPELERNADRAAFHAERDDVLAELAAWVERAAGVPPGRGLTFLLRALALTTGLSATEGDLATGLEECFAAFLAT